MADTSQSELRCIVVTPEAKLVDEVATSVILPLYDGEIGIAPRHSPMIGRLGFGEMKIRTGNEVKHFYVDGGFAQVADNVVSVMTNQAMPTSEVDGEQAEKMLEEALAAPAASGAALAVRQREIDRARGQLRVATNSK